MNARQPIRRWLALPSWPALGLALALVAGCGGGGGDAAAPPAGPPPPPAAVVVGSAGGTVNGPGGVVLEIPAGALAADTSLQIVATDAASSLPLPAGVEVDPGMFALLPHGTVFSVPVTLSVPRAAGAPDDGRSLLKTNADGSAWEQLVTTTSATTHSALITSFSGVGRMCLPGPGPCGSPRPGPPVISMQPVSGSVDEGGFVFIAVSAIGAQPLRYQWRSSFAGVLPRETTSALVINPVARSDDGVQLSVMVTDRFGQSVTSNPATVTVRAGPPVITSQPLDLEAIAGTTAVLSAASTSSVAQDLQWERFDPASGNWGAAPSQSAQLVLPNVQIASHDQALFRFTARNTGSAVASISRSARLTVRPAQTPPTIVDQPRDFATVAGRSAGFTVTATGGGLAYQWQRLDALNVWQPVGTDSASFTVSNTAIADDAALFRVIVSNLQGTVVSREARLAVPSTAGVNTVRVGGGLGHSLALRGDGSLYAWGANGAGELGRGSTSVSGMPQLVPGLAGVAIFAVGYQHSLAIVSDGSLHAWGSNALGQVGFGSNGTDRSSPVPVLGFAAPVRFAAAGVESSMAIAAPGQYWSWGRNYHGDGLSNARDLPSAVAQGFVRVAIGGWRGAFPHNLGLASDGTVWSWGRNPRGQLGRGGFRSEVFPSPVAGISQIVAVAAGAEHSLALAAGGTVYAWGDNRAGQVGTGTASAREPAPVRVVLPGIVVGIAAGQEHSMALLHDGRVFIWGRNDDGQLGNGTALQSATPMAVVGAWAGPIASIGAGAFHSLVLDAAGNVWGWGRNDFKQLGDLVGPTIDRPTQVPGVNLN